MTTPHDSWAHAYDAIYDGSFGAFYRTLTDETAALVAEYAPPPAHIVDFGAGTGRLAVPLARQGYRVTAIEPSGPMLMRLEVNAARAGVSVETYQQRIQERPPTSTADIALCLFTVTLYLLDEAALHAAARSMAAVLKPGGILLIDVPSRPMFVSSRLTVPGGERRVTIVPDPETDDLFRYEENTHIEIEGQMHHVQDGFAIRYWPAAVVLSTLDSHGLHRVGDVSDRFEGTGSEYFICRRQAE